MADADVNINSLMPQVTMYVAVSGMREFSIRKWLAVRCLKLAAKMLGCGIEIEEGDSEDCYSTDSLFDERSILSTDSEE